MTPLREEILGALACVQAAIRSDDVHGAALVQLAAAASALVRANEMLRPPPENVIPFPSLGHSVKVP